MSSSKRGASCQTKALYQATRHANPVVRSLEQSSDTGRRCIAREVLGVQDHESEQWAAAREEPGVRELESEQRAHEPVGNVLAEIADAPVGNVTDRLLNVAADENINNVANN